MDHTALFHNLTVVSKLSQQDKLLTKALLFEIDPPTNTRFAWRWWQREQRMENIEHLKSLIQLAMTTIALCDTSNTCGLIATPNQLGERLVSSLAAAVEGLKNLKETYRDNVGTETLLNVIVEDVEGFLTRRNS